MANHTLYIGWDTAGPVEPALFQFIDGLSAGTAAEYTLPSLTTSVTGLGTPFGPSPDASAGPFDWLCHMPYDPVTKQILLAGGRNRAVATATKMMIFDAVADEAYSFVNPYSAGTGHIYQAQCAIPEHRRHVFRGNQTGQMFLWDIDAQEYVGDLPDFGAAVDGESGGENPAYAWFPDWGVQGSIVVVARDTSADRAIVARFDWDDYEWKPNVLVNGTNVFTIGSEQDHPAGCYVPEASAGIFGVSQAAVGRPLLVVPSGGATPYWTADVCPGGVSVIPSHGLITPHPSRAAAIIVSRDDGRIYTYEFGTDEYIDRMAAPSIFSTTDQGITTISEADALISLHGTSGPAADEIWCFKIGNSLG